MSIKKRGQPEKKSDFVADQIVQEIRVGNYEIGSKLPSEKKIAEKAGVSRVAVREALSALRLSGIIETRHGEGSYVKSDNPEIIYDYGRWIERNEVNPYAILAVRRKIEPELAKLAVDNVDEKSKKELKGKLDNMAEAIKSDQLNGCFLKHWEFHTKIVEITQNLIAQQVYKIISSLMKEGYNQQGHWWKIIREYHESGQHCEGCLEDHTKLYKAILEEDINQLEKSFENHFEKMRERFSIPGGI